MPIINNDFPSVLTGDGKMKERVTEFILSWVEDSIFSIPNIDHLVKQVGYSRRTIENWFKEKYGLKLGEYILKRRLSIAAVMLRMTSISITDIAHMFNYHSSQGFARAFRNIMGLTPSEYRAAGVWDFDILQPSFLLSDFKVPELEICELNEVFVYTNTILEHDHLFDVSINDITKSLKKLLIESPERIQQLALIPQRSDLIGKGMSNLVEVIISYFSYDAEVTKKEEYLLTGKYAKLNFEGSWEKYSALNKIAFVRAMVKSNLTLRDGVHLMKVNSYSVEHINFDIYIPVL